MPDEFDNLISEMSGGAVQPDSGAAEGTEGAGNSQPQKKTPANNSPDNAQPQRRENFDDSEYENEDDAEFDTANATPEQRKAWPKKYTNALSRRDQALNKIKAENAALQKQLQEATGQAKIDNKSAAEAGKQLDATVAEKPKLEDFKDYGEFIEALTDWKADVRAAKITKDIADAQALQTQQQTEAAASQAVETKIATQASQLIQEYPEVLSVVQENADIIDSYPEEIVQLFGIIDHPERAFVALSQVQNGLEALGQMNPQQALYRLMQAEAHGLKMFPLKGANGANANEGEDDAAGASAGNRPEPKPISNAPTPMGKARSNPSGKKQIGDMSADELAKDPFFADVFN